MTKTNKLPADQYRVLKTWREQPTRFVQDVLGVTPEPWQAHVLTALAKPGAHVSVRSGHGVGKSALDSWAILWHHCTHYPAKTPCSAPTLHQLQDVLWAELGLWWKRLPEPMRVQFALRSSDQDMRFYVDTAPGESFAVGRTGRKENPEALQGFHSPNLLFILDEASGIDDIIFQVARGSLTGEGARVLMTSNPTRTSGYFYESHHSNRELWHTAKVASFPSESSQVSERYSHEVAKEYGEESNVYRVRVLGDFPRSEDNVLVPLSLVESALERDIEDTGFWRPVWGLDVARFGEDRTALCKRAGQFLREPIISWRGADLMETTGRVMEEYRRAEDLDKAGASRLETPRTIAVDSIGLGAGVIDRLRELGLPVSAVNVGETARQPGFMRLRDELFWEIRRWFEARDCRIVEDSALVGELCSMQYKHTSAGKLQLESKDEMKKRGLKSPDLADALALTFAVGLDVNEEQTVKERYGKRQRRRSWRAA